MTKLLGVGGGHAVMPRLVAAVRLVTSGVTVTLVNDVPRLYYSGMTPEYLVDRRWVRRYHLDARPYATLADARSASSGLPLSPRVAWRPVPNLPGPGPPPLPMLARLVFLTALVALLGCDDDPPPGSRTDAPEALPPSGVPDSAGTERTTERLLDPEPDTGAVTIHHADDAPPAPLPLHGIAGSCDARPTAPLCFAFTGPGWTMAAAQSECADAEGGVFQSAACPTEERIGECVYRPDGDASREVVHTFYAPMDPLVAEAVCRGSFRAL